MMQKRNPSVYLVLNWGRFWNSMSLKIFAPEWSLAEYDANRMFLRTSHNSNPDVGRTFCLFWIMNRNNPSLNWKKKNLLLLLQEISRCQSLDFIDGDNKALWLHFLDVYEVQYLAALLWRSTQSCSSHVCAANGFNLLHTTELGLRQQLQVRRGGKGWVDEQ